MNATEIESSVRAVIDAVRREGDEALCALTERWDGVRLRPSDLRVPRDAIEGADVDSPFAQAFRRAAERIRRFHARVKPESVTIEDPEGVRMGIRWTPIGAVGLYVPGGKASYPSTLAMTAVPARIAGVERVVVVSPPGPDGEVSRHVLMAAKILGLDEVYRIGGAQGVAALALGTPTIPRVDKIFGPGNAFVTEAKKQLYGEVGIDVLAGPSELVVYADASADPDAVAADLMAQAEHDESTRVTLLGTGPSVVAAVRRSIDRAIDTEPRREIIRRSLERSGRFEVVSSDAEAARRIDEIAPEHLSIQTEEPWRALLLVRNAGAIYVGRDSPVAVGDYYAGPNHVLPTGGAARYASCLSVEDFMKRTNVVETTREFLRQRGGDVEVLALGERLPAHARSVSVRRGGAAKARPGLRSVPAYSLVDEDAEVKVNQNESPWDVPDDIKDEVARKLRELPWNRYHQRIPEQFLEVVARDAGFPPDGVLAASGSNLILQWIFEAYCRPGSSAVVPTPSFALYGLWAEACEARLQAVPLGPRFAYDAPLFAEAIGERAPALAVLCLPNNPTGSEMGSSDVRRVAEAAAAAGSVLVVDEAYREFTGHEFDRTWLPREFPNAILVRTCSKAFSAAGLRLGYALAHPDLARDLRKLVPPFHLSIFAAVFGLTVWERKGIFLDRVKEILTERDRLMRELGTIAGLEVLPTHANFFLVRVEDAPGLHAALKERGILVRAPGGDPSLAGCLRINAGTPAENERLVAAVREILGGRGARGPQAGGPRSHPPTKEAP